MTPETLINAAVLGYMYLVSQMMMHSLGNRKVNNLLVKEGMDMYTND